MHPTESTIQSFTDYLKFEKRYSIHTLTAYQNDLEEFLLFQSKNYGSLSLKEITASMIRSWLAELKQGGMTAKSINRKLSTLRSFYKFQMKMGVVEVSPMNSIVAPKTGKRLPVFVKENEAEDLMELLAGTSENWKSLNAKMLLTLFYNTGMRLSELITLKEKQLDLGRSQIKVLGKGNKERIIPISKEQVIMIKDYQRLKRKEFEKPDDDVLLVTEKGKKLYAKYAYLLVREYLSYAGTLDKKSPHVLRHTFATHLMNRGADLNAVKELLGHSSLSSTQIYTHNTIDKLKDIHKKAHPKS